MKTIPPFYLLALFFSLFLFACNADTSSHKEDAFNSGDSLVLLEKKVSEIPFAEYDMVISDIPFPFEIIENLYSKKVPFDQTAMNDITVVSKYNQYHSKALNLGVYGADLAYSVTYEQFQQLGAYVKNTKRLAEELNIPYAFDQSMMDKYSKFKDNKDSLTRIVYDSYSQVDKALKNNERVSLAALVVAGSWLEGLYLSTKTFINTPKTAENKSLYNIIGEQKQSLLIVIKLLKENQTDEFISGIISELKKITSEYNNLTSDVEMNEKQLIAIHSKVEALRNKIIKGQ